MPCVVGKSADVMPMRSTCGEAACPGCAENPEAAVAAVISPRLVSIPGFLHLITRCHRYASDPEAGSWLRDRKVQGLCQRLLLKFHRHGRALDHAHDRCRIDD